MDNFENFFSHTSTETDPVEVEDQTTETPEIEVEEVSPEPEPQVEEPAVEEPAAQIEDAKEDPKMVPLTALHQERARARQAMEEANTLRQQMQSLQAAQTSKNLPDPYDDPQGYAAAQQQAIAAQVAEQVALQNLNLSRIRAVEKHGAEYMNEVADWAGEHAKSDPTFEARLFAQPDPAEWVIQEKKRNDELNLFRTDREAFLRAEFEKMGLSTVAANVEAATPPAKKMNGPASIVNAKSRDSAEPMKPTDAFDAIFSKTIKE